MRTGVLAIPAGLWVTRACLRSRPVNVWLPPERTWSRPVGGVGFELIPGEMSWRRYTCRVDTDALTFAVEPAGNADALACVRAYVDELGARFPHGFEPAGCGVVDPVELGPPGGGFVVVRAAGRAVGCGGVRMLSPGVGEIKRMWLHPDVRGRGAGRRLLATLEDLARTLGQDVVRLDTSRHLDEAIGLYTSTGYVAIDRYNDNADADHWFEKQLGGGAPDSHLDP